MKILNKLRTKSIKIASMIIRSYLRKKRLGVNSHDLNSFEITTIVQNTEFKKPSETLLELVSKIAKSYNSFEYKDEFNNESLWDIYNSAYVGEHYRLIALVAKTLEAKKVVEIGTLRGASAASILHNTDANVVGYDIISAKTFKDKYINDAFYNNGRFIEKIGDLYEESHLKQFIEDVKSSDILFLDGPKNYVFEKYIFEKLIEVKFKKNIIMIVDDIKLGPMVELWNSIRLEKIDISFIGHWSGTGLVLLKGENNS